MTAAADYIYVLRPVRAGMATDGPDERESDIIDRHVTYLEDLTQRETVLLAGHTLAPELGMLGIVILAAGSEDRAREIMLQDPAVAEGILQSELHPFNLALLSPAIVTSADSAAAS